MGSPVNRIVQWIGYGDVHPGCYTVCKNCAGMDTYTWTAWVAGPPQLLNEKWEDVAKCVSFQYSLVENRETKSSDPFQMHRCDKQSMGGAMALTTMSSPEAACLPPFHPFSRKSGEWGWWWGGKGAEVLLEDVRRRLEFTISRQSQN